MRTKVFLILCALLCFTALGATATYADGIPDPKITEGGTGSCNIATFTEDFLLQTFIIPVECAGFPVDFKNQVLGTDDEELTLQSLVVTTPTDGGVITSCPTGKGAPLGKGFVSSPNSCTFTDQGVTFGEAYSLNFDGFTFGTNGTLDVTLAGSTSPATVPEPATILMIMAGLAVLLIPRKRLHLAGINL